MGYIINTRSQEASKINNLMNIRKGNSYYFPNMGMNLISFIQSEQEYTLKMIDKVILQELEPYNIASITEFKSSIQDFSYSLSVTIKDNNYNFSFKG